MLVRPHVHAVESVGKESIASAPLVAVQAPTDKLSLVLWGVDWREHFPQELTADGVSVDSVEYERALPFISQCYPEIFGEAESRFARAKECNARDRYYQVAGDFFEFRHNERVVGMFVGNPIDWSTYYIRSTAFLQEYQGRALYQRFLKVLYQQLQLSGVERIEAETAPSNLQCVAALMRQRFNVSGTVLSERFGALTRFTKFLDGGSEDVFLEQFCASGHMHKKNGRRKTTVKDAPTRPSDTSALER